MINLLSIGYNPGPLGSVSRLGGPELSEARFGAKQSPTALMPDTFVRFEGESKKAHRSDRKGDDYSRYRYNNTLAPLGLYHKLIKPEAQQLHAELGQRLEGYVGQHGERRLDIPFIKRQLRVGEVGFSIFDFETTGVENKDRIIQIAANPIKPDLTLDHARGVYQLVHPGEDENGNMFPIHPGASRTHGIHSTDLEGQPRIEDILLDLRKDPRGALKERDLLVAYNATFEIGALDDKDARQLGTPVGMLNKAINRWNRSERVSQARLSKADLALTLDPYVLLLRIHPFVSQKKRLENHYKILMGTELENKHDAQADVMATLDVLKYVFKYLQKHSIPLPWAQAAEKVLKRSNADWDNLDDRAKSGAIARLVRQSRPVFERKFGPADEPLKIIDILRFQHGSIPTHQIHGTKSYYPVLDINLSKFGYDATRKWDGTDVLDADIARQVRAERHQETPGFNHVPVKEGEKLIDPAVLEGVEKARASGTQGLNPHTDPLFSGRNARKLSPQLPRWERLA